MTTLDPAVQKLLAMMQQARRPPFESLSPEAARRAYAASWDVMQLPGGEVASVQDVAIATAAGELMLRVYRGQGTQPQEPLPCMVFLHGGGWVIGNLDSHDRLCRRLATLAGICVVAVNYRLAPEHPFPAAIDDALSALQWVADHAGMLHIHPAAIGVGGDSAGGNLAAALALMSRDGVAPKLAYQALLYPVVDLTASSESYRRVTSGLPLTAATMHYFIAHYAPNPQDRLDWRASPLRAPSLAGTPQALVLTVAHDPLCDEGRDYARRLDEAGVRVAAMHHNDQMHGVLSQSRLVPAGQLIADQVWAAIGHALHGAAAEAAE